MSKYFLVNPEINHQEKKVILKQQKESQQRRNDFELSKKERDKKVLSEEDNLLFVEGRIIIKIDTDSKDSWTFSSGMQIDLKRRFNNLNRRQTEPVNCIVISGDNIPKGTEILVHPNAIHDSNRIFSYKSDTGAIQYYSIPKDNCFAYYDDGWKPLKGFDFALRVFKPYTGIVQGIEPTLVKNTLYVTTGELKDKVVMTLEACDYTIVFQDKNGQEGQIIRFRPFGDEKTNREPEAIAILTEETKKVKNGELLVGIEISDAKKI